MPPALKEGNSPKLVMVVDRTQDLPMLLRRQSFSHRNNYRIPLKWLFKILKDDAVKVLHSVCQQIWKTQQWPQYWGRSLFNPLRRTIPKNVQTTVQLHSFHKLAQNPSS